MLRTNPFLLLLFCVLFASPLFAEVVVDPNGFELQEVPTGTSSIEIMTLSNLGDAEVDFSINVEVAEEFMAPNRDRRGGPDDMGYEWRDNLEDDGPEFEWIDIRENEGVRQFRLGDDENTGRIDLGWEFPFYNEVFDFIYVDSDGWASFVNQSQNIETAYPFPSNDQNWFYTLAIMNGDWAGDWNGAGPLYFWSNGRDQAVITYNQWDNRNDQNHADFQIILNADGLITYQYGDGMDNRAWMDWSHVGINGADGLGFQMVERGQAAGYIESGRVIAFGPPGAWISWIAVDPSEGSIRGGDEFEVDVIFNAEGIEEGDYSASIFIETSDGENLEVSVDMNVVGGPAIFSDVQEWDFGNVFVGFEADAAIPVENIGQEDLVIDEIASNNPDVFYAEDAPNGGWVIAPGEVLDVIIHATPAAQGADDGVFVVSSNAINFPEVPFRVSVNGLIRPDIFVDPMGIEVDLNTGESTERSVNIANEGGSDLIIEIEHVIISEPDRDQNNRNVRQTNGQAGPRRDEVDLDGMTFACFQDNSNWGWLDEGMRQDPLLNNENFISFRNGNSWAEENFEDYDAIVMSTYGQRFVNEYNANYDRFCEYIDGGGALYAEMGDANQGVRTPGGIMNDWGINSSNGFLTVSPEQGDDNYSLFAEICHESQPDFWNVDERIEGGSFLHSGFQLRQFDEGLDNGTLEYYQVLAVHENDRNAPGVIVYGYGGGTVMVVGHPVGNCWFWWTGEGMWGSIASEILYFLTQAGSAQWLTYEPTEMVLRPDEDSDVIITLDATGLYTGEYEADLHILSNDPEDPDIAVGILINCQGAPDMVPEWDEAFGFPNVVDWNGAYEDLFTGGPYTIPVTISNEGTEPLSIEDYISNHNYFTTNFEQEFEIPIGESVEMVLTFDAPAEEPDDYNAIVTIISDDPDEPEFDIALHADASTPPIMDVDPAGFEEDMVTGEVIETSITISNDGDALLRWTSGFEVISEPDMDNAGRNVRSTANQVGPRRDEVDLGGMMFAVLQDQTWWEFLDDRMMEQDPLLTRNGENANYVTFRNADAWNNIEFEEYDAIVYGGCAQSENFNNAYNANLDRFMEYLDGGGGAYTETGDQNAPIRLPGGFNNNAQGNNNGTLVVSPDPNDDNYSLLAEIFQASQPDFWNEGEVIEGSSFLHSSYQTNQFQEALDGGAIEWWQNIAVPEGQQTAGAIAYGIGSGTVLAVGHPLGYGWVRHVDQGMWGSMAAEILFYLTEMGGSKWFVYEPTEGTVESDDSAEIFVTLDAAGLFTGDYEGDLTINSNDPANPQVVVSFIIHVEGAPDLVVEWPEEIGFPNVIDWNAAYEDLFTGGPYTTIITLNNNGTEPLLVEGMEIDNEFFTSNFDNEVEIPIGESVDVELTFNAPADQPNDYNAVLTIFSDDPIEMEFDIALHADASTPPIIDVNPVGIEEDMVTGEVIETTIEISNDGDALLRWNADFEILSEPNLDDAGRSVRSIDSQYGPRRDEVDLDGMTFACFQDNGNWGWLDEGMGRDPLLNNENFLSFRNGNSWAEENFEDYDAIVMSTYGQNFVNQYNANYDRFCEYIDGGGALYAEMGDANQGVRTPGGIMNDWNINSWNGFLTVSPDPNADNYSLFAEICHESQPDFWNVDELIEGSSWLHSGFQLRQFDEGVDNGTLEYYQVLAVHENDRNAPGAIVYGYGGGTVMVVGHPVGHCWQWFNQEGMWGSIAAEILYFLTQAGSGQWFTYEPDEGEIAPGDGGEIFVILDAAGLFAGDYEGELTILSNDPATPETVVSVILHVEGAPDLVIEWPEEIGYPNIIDWNIAFDDLFTGGPYTIPVTFTNDGTEILLVEGFESNHEFFTTDLADEIEIPTGESVEVNFTFNAPANQPDDYNAVVTIFSDDPLEGEFDIALHADASLPPIIALDIIGIEADLLTGESQEFPINVANDGDAPLRGTIEVVSIDEPDVDVVGRSVRSISLERAANRDRRGEVDGEGYEWRDNLEDDGPEYEWIDIRENEGVRQFRLGDDENTGRIDLGWEFPFYNEVFDFIYVDSDGWASFVNQSQTISTAYPFPSNDQQWFYTLAILNGDWAGDWNGAGPLYFWSNGQDEAVITYNQWDNRNGQNHADFQILLNANGLVTYQYGNGIADRGWMDWSHVGINGADGLGFQMVERGQAMGYIEEGRAIGFGPARAWLSWISVDISEYELDPGDDIEVMLTLNAEGLIGGDYEGSVNFDSNDPADPHVEVSVLLTVTGAPDIAIEWPEEIGFPNIVNWNDAYLDVFSGGPYPIPITISNIGTEVLIVSDISSDHEYFGSDVDGDLEIPIGESVDVNFIFNGAEQGDYNAVMVVTSDDPDMELYEIALHAGATLPPQMAVAPMEIAEDMVTGEVIEPVITISNDGDAVLRWDSEFEVISEPDVDSRVRNVRSTDGQVGPRRDEVDLDGMTFACFQDNGNWGWLDEGMRQDPLLNNENFLSFRNGNSWAEENFEDYDAIVMSTYGQNFVNQYNANYDRFCEYIDGGGALYAEMGDANQGVRTPGGIMNDWGINSANGFLTVSPDPGDDNYSLFAEICHESQPNFWNVDERIEGNSWLHSGFQLRQFDEGVDNGTLEYYQVIAVHENDRNAPGAIVYGYGGGTVMVVGHPVGHCWFNYNQEGMWGSIASEILYFLTQAGAAQWFTYEPDAGEIAPGEEEEIFAVISAEGLISGAYIGELTIFSNDPANQIVVVSIEINVEGASDINPVWSEEAGYAEVIDWNAVNEDLFTGVAYTIPVTLNNEGTDLLIVSDFVSDNDNFTVPFDQDIEVEIGDAVVVDFIFEASEDGPGDFNATMTIVSNDPDEAEFVINLHAEAGLPPVISVDPEELMAGMLLDDEPIDQMFLIGNDEGEFRSDLQFEISIEAIEEERDQVNRSIRSINPDRSVNRDNRGDADDMGWEWRDNLEDDGPEFEWVDVRELDGVRAFNMGDDQNTGALELGWTYTFWGREFQTIYANTDAWASFTYTGDAYNNSPAGYPLAANGNALNANFIQLMQIDFWDGTDVWYWTNEQDLARIMWAGDHRVMFELAIHGNGLAVMQYGDGVGAANVGVNLGDAEHGWFMGNQIANGRAIGFGPANAWTTWVSAEPMEGTVAAGEFAEVTVTFDASELENMAEYHAILTVSSNDPENPEVMVPITLLTGQREEEQELALGRGWNMVSLRVDPVEFYVDDAPGPDVELMFAQLEDEEGNQPIQLLKNEDGLFWAPAWFFNNIPFWNLPEGYQVNVDSDQIAVFVGQVIPADADIPLEPAWNLMAYFPNYDLNASRPDFYVLSSIIDMVVLAKDSDGLFMSPGWDFSNMQPWTAGQGYQINIDSEEAIVFNYPPEQQEELAFARVEGSDSHWTAPAATGSNMSILVNTISGMQLGEGDQIAVFSVAGQFLGSNVLTEEQCGLSVWGDDESTEAVDGAKKNDELSLKIWDADLQIERDLNVDLVHMGSLVYEADSFVVLDVSVAAEVPNDFYLSQNYPNPFNNVTKLAYGMPEAGDVSIRVFDLNGRLVADLVSGSVNAGHHITLWDASSASTGIYMVRMESTTGFKAVRKVMLVK